MKILVTGSTGFIGSHIKNSLSELYEVIGLTRKEALDSSFMQLDLLDFQNLKLAYKERFDAIVHCASVLASPENNRDMSLFYENIRITESLISLIQWWKPRVVINLSTIGVYPNLDGVYDEDSVIKPSFNYEGLYGLAKFCSEELLSFHLKNSKVRLVNLRVGQTIGHGMRSDRVYSKMKENLLSKNIIEVYGGGKRVSSFVSIQYLVKVIRQILLSEQINGTYNLAEYSSTYRELAERIISEFGNTKSKIKILDEGTRANVRIDSRKLKKILK